MAEYLNMRRAAARLSLAAGACCVLAGAASAQALPDPTRPPPLLEMAQEPGGEQQAGPLLQSILISPNRRVAVVSGRILTLGDKLGEAEVIRISEGEVALRKGRELQILKLHPARKAVSAVSKREAGRDRSRLE